MNDKKSLFQLIKEHKTELLIGSATTFSIIGCIIITKKYNTSKHIKIEKPITVNGNAVIFQELGVVNN